MPRARWARGIVGRGCYRTFALRASVWGSAEDAVPGRDGEGRVVGEDAVDAELVEVREESRGVALGPEEVRRGRVALPVLHRQEGVLRPYRPGVHGETGVVSVGDQSRRRQYVVARVDRDDPGEARADAVGVLRDPLQPGGRDQVGVGPRVVVRDEVVRRALRVDQLDQLDAGPLVERPQVRGLERLDEDLVVLALEAVLARSLSSSSSRGSPMPRK